MKLSVSLPTIKDALNRSRAICGKGHIPILANVLISAIDGKVTLQTTDLERWHVETIDADVEQPGATTVDARHLYSAVVTNAGADMVSLSGCDGGLTVLVGQSRYKFATLAAEDFPTAAEATDSIAVLVDGPLLAGALGRAAGAFGTDPARPFLRGAHLAFRDGRLCVEGTDGKRLHVVSLPPGACAKVPNVIIPSQAISNLRAVAQLGDVATFHVSDRMLSASCAGVKFQTKLIDGQYPDTTRLTRPLNGAAEMRAGTDALISSVRRAMPLSDDKNHTIKLHADAGSLHLRTSSDRGQESHVEMDAEGKIDTAVNGTQLLSLLDALGGENCIFATKGADTPIRITNPADDSFVGLLVPVRA